MSGRHSSQARLLPTDGASRVYSFPPIVAADARTLILGTMPGVASLEAGQYYGHPRNDFWPIMEALFEMPSGLSYGQRCDALRRSRVAVWDVLQTCDRAGSLDSAIETSSIVVNDFDALLKRCPELTRIAFNGKMAEKLFLRHVLGVGRTKVAAREALTLNSRITLHSLPSTSPANASLTRLQKIEYWRVLCSETPVG